MKLCAHKNDEVLRYTSSGCNEAFTVRSSSLNQVPMQPPGTVAGASCSCNRASLVSFGCSRKVKAVRPARDQGPPASGAAVKRLESGPNAAESQRKYGPGTVVAMLWTAVKAYRLQLIAI